MSHRPALRGKAGSASFGGTSRQVTSTSLSAGSAAHGKLTSIFIPIGEACPVVALIRCPHSQDKWHGKGVDGRVGGVQRELVALVASSHHDEGTRGPGSLERVLQGRVDLREPGPRGADDLGTLTAAGSMERSPSALLQHQHWR